MKLGVLILAHDNPANTARLAKLLLDSDCSVCLHYDLKGGDAPLKEIKQHLGSLWKQLILAKRVRVKWGEWSIVEATLNGLAALLGSGQELDYVHLMSGADYPIRPIPEFRAFLERHNGVDFIESHAISRRQWVKDGLSRERYQYRHFFNFKTHPKLFHWSWKAQSFLKIRKKPPAGLSIHMGSQWWTLTAATCQVVLQRGRSREMVRFFRRSWIPDEMFVQTIAAQTGRKHSNRHLTLYQFNSYGVPIVYHDTHAEYLSRQPFFFVRKLSPFARGLRDELDLVVSGKRQARHFHDWDVGSPTEEYSKFRTQHRKGAPGRRLPGQIPPGKLGELAWNDRRYLVILGRSTFELEQVASRLRQISDVVCHGFLFASHEVDFESGSTSFAGYSRSATVLRDHSPSTFLADVIASSPHKTTCFLLRRQEAAHFLNDTLRMDPNASIIVVKGGILRAYMDIYGTDRTSVRGRSDQFQVEMEAARIVAFQRESNGWASELLTKVEVLPKLTVKPKPDSSADQPVPVVAATFHNVDILNLQWPRHLIKAALESGVEVMRAAALSSASQNFSMRPQPVDISLCIALLRLCQSREQRRRLLTEVLAPVKTPYLAVVCVDRSSASEIAQQLSLPGHFSFPENQPDYVTELLTEVIQYEVSRERRPAVFVFAADDVSLIEAVLLDPDANLLAVKQRSSRLGSSEANSCEYASVPTELDLDIAWSEFEGQLTQSLCRSLVVAGGGWAREAAGFIVCGFSALSGTAREIERSLMVVESGTPQGGNIARDET